MRSPAPAIGGIHRDFEADVLERMIRHRATMHGCPIIAVESGLDGSIAFRFAGLRDGAQWEGGMRMSAAEIEKRHAFADPEAVTECALQILSHIGTRPDG